MAIRGLISPTLTTEEAYQAGVRLGTAVRKVRGGPKNLHKDLRRYVAEPFFDYDTCDAISRGFTLGYFGAPSAVERHHYIRADT